VIPDPILNRSCDQPTENSGKVRSGCAESRMKGSQYYETSRSMAVRHTEALRAWIGCLWRLRRSQTQCYRPGLSQVRRFTCPHLRPIRLSARRTRMIEVPCTLTGRETPTLAAGDEHEVQPAPCIFCGETIAHVNDSGKGWMLGAIVDGEARTYLYCTSGPCARGSDWWIDDAASTPSFSGWSSAGPAQQLSGFRPRGRVRLAVAPTGSQ
jgi:hypothetical protein